MGFNSFNRRFFAGHGLAGFMLAAAGCQSSDSGFLGFGKKDTSPPPPQDPKVLASQLRAYCPKVTVKDGGAFFNNSAKDVQKPKSRKKTDVAQDTPPADEATPQDDSNRIIYQASITDMTRDCDSSGGSLKMKIAVAGRIVPGPRFSPGTVTLPIRISVVHGSDVLYSQLHPYQVQATDPATATQFVFTDDNIVVPLPSAQDYLGVVGFDEGGSKATAEKGKKSSKHRKKVAATN